MTEGIDWNLSIKDRERFSQNVSAFRRELTMSNIVLIPVSLDQSMTSLSAEGVGNSTSTTTATTLM